MKPDKRWLLLRLLELHGGHPNGISRVPEWCLADDVGWACPLGPIHPKRVQDILYKWSDKGWWNYGVSARTGWLTEKGLAEANKIKEVS